MRFEDALRLAGLRPREIAADGKWRRCPTDDKPKRQNGAYKLAIGGGRGWFRNWATSDGISTWDDDRETEVRAIDPERARAQRDAERRKRIAAMRGARDFWSAASSLNRLHPYIEAKGLSALGCAGLRQHRGLLVVPVWHGQWIVSVQTISEDGEKRFWPGAPVKAGCFVIERRRPALVALVEGLATGLAVYQAVRQSSVVVCFDASNMVAVADRLRPTGSVVIAADNDHKTAQRTGINPGLEKARSAAQLIDCDIAYPDGIEGSDYADALKEWGLGAAKRIERQILARSRYVSSRELAPEAPS
jgi:putative DNA primase/helicase